MLVEGIWTLLGTLFGMLTGGRRQKIRFYFHLPHCFWIVCANGTFLDVFERIFGSTLTTLTQGWMAHATFLRR